VAGRDPQLLPKLPLCKVGVGQWSLPRLPRSVLVSGNTSPSPTPTPQLPPLSWAIGPFGRTETTPTRAKDSGALPSERLLGQWLCPGPYQPWGEGVWLEDWNLYAIIFDFVIFPLGTLSSSFPLLSMYANSPPSWTLPFYTPARGVPMF